MTGKRFWCGVCGLACVVASALIGVGGAVAAGPDAVSDRFAFPFLSHGRGLTQHKDMWLLPYSHSSRYKGRDSEVIFQLGGKHDVFGTNLYVAYTQVSFWQAYNTGESSPFRDSNYNPEMFYRFGERRLGPWPFAGDVGIEHQSNGQTVPLSRSWNLLYAAPYLRGDHWLAYVKLRYRIPESAKETPLSAEGDDNPDITDYLGYSDIHLYYAFPHEILLHLQVRGYLGVEKGNVSLNASIPFTGEKDAFFVLRLFSGYGESMVDYRRPIDRVGIGVMFQR